MEEFSEIWLRRTLILVVALYAINILGLGFLLSPFDYDHLSTYYEIAWRFWRHNASLPQYNPFLCGGRTLGGDPQVPIFHPLVLLVPVLGAVWLVKLEMLGQLALGTYGLFGCFRAFEVSKLGRLWGCFLFLAGGGVVAKFLAGHVTLGFYFLLPLFLALSYQLAEEKRALSKPFLAYLLLFAYAGLYKPNFIIQLVPVLGIEVATRSLVSRTLRPALYFTAGVLFVVFANAASYYPAHLYFSEFPRNDGYPAKFISPVVLLLNLILPLKTIPNTWYGPFFLQRHEYNNFIGPLGLFFGLVGIKESLKREKGKTLGLLAFILASAWLGFGTPSPAFHGQWPFSWLTRFWPGFDTIRVPTRFWFGAGFGLILFSAIGLRPPQRNWKHYLFVTVGIFPVFLCFAVNLSRVSLGALQSQWAVAPRYEADFRWVHSEADRSFLPIRQGFGTIECVENMEVHRASRLRPGPLLSLIETNMTGETTVTGKWQAWNRFELDTKMPFGKQLSININDSPLWEIEGTGAELVHEPGNLLTLRVTGEPVRARLIFLQPGVKMGFYLSLGAWLVFAYLVFRVFKLSEAG